MARISGQVVSVTNGSVSALGGVSVVLSGASSGVTQTDVNGRYSFENVPTATHTVAVSKPGFVFDPPSRTINVAGESIANFSTVLNAALTGRVFLSGVGNIMMNADGSNVNIAGFGLSGPAFGCAFYVNCFTSLNTKSSPDGRKTAHIIATGRDFPYRDWVDLRIAIDDFAGFSRQFIYTYGPTVGSSAELEWSPDGTKLVFNKVVPGPSNSSVGSLRTINVDGTNETIVLQDAGRFADPDWSPDGSKILFGRLETVNPDGSGRTLLTSGNGDRHGRWSPDGSKIAFIRPVGVQSPTGRIFTMNADGSGQTAITTDDDFYDLQWSPEGTKIGFTRCSSSSCDYGIMNADGSDPIVIKESTFSIFNSWTPIPSVETPTGTNVGVSVGTVGVEFSGVGTAGITTINPISSFMSIPPPIGFVLAGQAYEITTTAVVAPPITVCLTAGPPDISESYFNTLSILHGENGVLVDRTTSRNFPTRRICATVNSLSPFVMAEQVDPALPSITGLVLDNNNKPLVNVDVSLTGTDARTTVTDSNGAFRFVNLTPNGNYNVSPKLPGFMFEEYNKDLIGLNGEQMIIFIGTEKTFSVSGRAIDIDGEGIAGVVVSVSGNASLAATTDVNGNYTITALPADVPYFITAAKGGITFVQETFFTEVLTTDQTGIDFTEKLSPTSAGVSISGRAVATNGRGINGARVTLSDMNGVLRSTLTSSFGLYRFDDVRVGETYFLTILSKRFIFTPDLQVLNLTDAMQNVDFIASGER